MSYYSALVSFFIIRLEIIQRHSHSLQFGITATCLITEIWRSSLQIYNWLMTNPVMGNLIGRRKISRKPLLNSPKLNVLINQYPVLKLQLDEAFFFNSKLSMDTNLTTIIRNTKIYHISKKLPVFSRWVSNINENVRLGMLALMLIIIWLY